MSQNHLTQAKSPYLLQHADNPVHWYEWCETALSEAKSQNKPILLSIGYSACHWCHVMAHESFEDAETAALMNEHFINIKVDREERPDLDKIYQQAHQLLSQRGGGWPLTVFIDPRDHIPFFSGTYFPKESKYGMSSFEKILQQVAKVYHEQNDEVVKQNNVLQGALAKLDQTQPCDHTNTAVSQKANEELAQEYDDENGGFGHAPKFPHPAYLQRLLDSSITTQNTQHKKMLRHTLTQMARGGIYDQLAGGFFRYSVDEKWHIPHFEKMLYDNAQLLTVYTLASAYNKEPLYAVTAQAIANWTLNEMLADDGGFYATLDADSDGDEGKYYIWDKYELLDHLNNDEYRLLAAYYGFNGIPNFEGCWHLHITRPLEEIATRLDIHQRQAPLLLASAHEKLLGLREQRNKPHCDHKILTSWNGLMIKALSLAGQHFNNDQYLAAADASLAFIQQNSWSGTKLHACYKDNEAYYNAYLDDYIFLIDALVTFLQIRWNSDYCHWLQQLCETVIDEFYDNEHGGFFFTSKHHEQLIQRPKIYMDEATPAANGVAAMVFYQLGHLFDQQHYLDIAEKTIKASWQKLEHFPSAHASLLNAFELSQQLPEVIVIRGPQSQLDPWQTYAHADYKPNRLTFVIPNDAEVPENFKAAYPAQDNTVCAYICRNGQCELPITDLKVFGQKLID